VCSCRQDVPFKSDARTTPLEFFTAFSAEGHTPHIWVNNAGIAPRRPALDISAADWDDVLNLNLRGAYLAPAAPLRR